MHRSKFVRIIKKIQGQSFGLCSSSFYCRHSVWLYCTSRGDLSTHTANISYFTRLPTKDLALGYKPQIAGRKYLPGSTSGGFPEFLHGPEDGHTFPMAYKVTKPQEFDVKAWSQKCRELIDAKLAVFGAILISKMHRSKFVRIIKKIQGQSFGLCSSSFYCRHSVWLYCTSRGDLSTHTANISYFTRLPTKDLALGYKPQIAGRKYLPGSTSGGFPEFLHGPEDGHTFPMAYKVTKPQEFDVKAWSQKCRELIDAKLAVFGAILIRNLPLQNMEDFRSFIQGLEYTFFEHGVTGYRTRLGANVYTASDDPPEVTMEPHNEVSYSPVFPKKVIMFCVKEPDPFCGGETVLLKNRDLTTLLNPELIRKLEEKKIRYQAFLPNKDEKSELQKSWQDRFWVDDPQEVEKILKTNGWSFSWDKDKNLQYWYIHSPVMLHPVTGEKIWFNQVTSYHASYFRALPQYEDVNIPDDHFPFHSYYGDGSDIESEVLQHIRAAMWSCAIGFRWRMHDVAVIDNSQVLHGRMGWTGQRTLVTTLTDE